ncbi:U32 family peptidase [Sulfurospirillum sp. T05]|uniref:U32 family peptidase n=1 Tax=Sulfurospirillum tamanense TaxID=2813362 RepID=A0ABS2WT62_9BACT|nr:peptidase U32 family protein [Sulfurospirillum tamanensis]MBN2964849.1 U32 family peptidase [Sulfurospirillum tamanensis]
MKRPELLSPAGNPEKLKLALAYGADAVYGGVSHFSLRIRSGKEFTYESFHEAVEYTHRLGKKIYVTINGFPFNAQIELLKKHISTMAAMKPDAFIMATPGVVRLSRELAPEIPVHLSTQANVLNYLDAQVYWDLGVKRIVAAREIGLKDLAGIKERLPELELEAFVHGSMCFAYSGRCLISSVQSGRVPNRGSCANDCRFPYTLYAKNEETDTLFRLEEDETGTHIMNAKDLNLAVHVEEIIQSGVVDALKIEGRTKSPYYVATTARAYRMAIEDALVGNFQPKRYEEELDTIKNRGFFDGYLVHRPFEKHQAQNLKTSIVEGSAQVFALVDESGSFFHAKDTVAPAQWYEVVTPYNAPFVAPMCNEIGEIKTAQGKTWLQFFQIETDLGKKLEAIHSGNTNAVKLPCALPPFSFLRK